MRDVASRLADRLPADRLLLDDDSLRAHRHDRSGWEPAGLPSAVVTPRSTAEVQAVLEVANETGTPVVVRGAGTGLSGAATATAGELVLSTAALNAITELSAADQLAVVQPGVVTAELDRAAGEHGLRYAPDPASVEISTIGGNIATNAGGLRCAKYGVTRDSVLGLEVVLADGRVVRTGRRTVKGVTGYDLTGLFVGSEGTLGVVTSATVRLRPAPAETATVAAFFDSVEKAAAAVGRLRVQPAIAELLDADALEAVDAAQNTSFRARGAAFLLVQTDGHGAGAEAELVRADLAPLATGVEVTTDPAVAGELLAARRFALPSLEKQGRVLIEDIAVPRARLAEAVAAIAAITRRHGVTAATLAHAGDGNLHPIFVIDRAAAEIPEAVWAAAGEVFETALRLGGTLTGEHGVGVLKRKWLPGELSPDTLALHHSVKRLFDPRGILNPGKAI
ncbi:FAD-binding protein [Amycolatopsis acidicola]|uniref:FAD-binding protein n=1 Tax=Amycolatopsis acidicola TaxID=2596893 RepID=A0A5N0UZT5_9PSEU|nr:FAD-linked oxidase C-terminal domain-containing protein [Amycolatopsis acidicola]KAA9157281.1 FAD-binding protein [Amycolatopsis acidicola]